MGYVDGERGDYHIRKTISAGVIVTNGISILLGHATGQRHWDIPKGMIDRGETAARAALRELEEEAGLYAELSELEEIGVVGYSKRKNLHLFYLRVARMPDIRDLHCTSYFGNGRNKRPEIDRYVVVSYSDIGNYCVPNMTRALKGCLLSEFRSLWSVRGTTDQT